MALRPVYSVQIMALAPALPHNFVTVPDGVRIIVRDIDAVELTGGGAGACQFVGPATNVIWAFQRGATLNTAVGQWRGRQVFNPGESFDFQAVSGTWDVQISGYELTLP
jgi:hypothetical protein